MKMWIGVMLMLTAGVAGARPAGPVEDGLNVEEIVVPLVEAEDTPDPVVCRCREVYHGYQNVEISGFLFCGIRQAEFRPSGKNQIWLVERGVPVERYRAVEAACETGMPARKRVFVRVSARVSPAREGGYGSFGIYPHQVVIDKIVELRAAAPSDLKVLSAPELAMN